MASCLVNRWYTFRFKCSFLTICQAAFKKHPSPHKTTVFGNPQTLRFKTLYFLTQVLSRSKLYFTCLSFCKVTYTYSKAWHTPQFKNEIKLSKIISIQANHFTEVFFFSCELCSMQFFTWKNPYYLKLFTLSVFHCSTCLWRHLGLLNVWH